MDVFKKQTLCRRIPIPMSCTENIPDELHKYLSKLEGKCIEEGYVKSNSIELLSHTCGIIKGSNVIIHATFVCEISNPEVGQVLECIVVDNSRAGIKARLQNESPFIIFIPRTNSLPELDENIKLNVEVIAKRYEINDAKISIIASLLEIVKPVKPEVIVVIRPDIFVFHLKSADSKPGKGTHEMGDPKLYIELSRKKNWRQILSPYDTSEFEWCGSNGITFPPGTKWYTLEHCIQACKLYLKDPLFANLLKVGEKHGASDVKHLNRKSGKYIIELAKDQLDHWHRIRDSIKYDASHAMFSHHPNKMEILKLTKTAMLMHYDRSKPLTRYIHYERVRDN